jgi:hypothetical protein
MAPTKRFKQAEGRSRFAQLFLSKPSELKPDGADEIPQRAHHRINKSTVIEKLIDRQEES